MWQNFHPTHLFWKDGLLMEWNKSYLLVELVSEKNSTVTRINLKSLGNEHVVLLKQGIDVCHLVFNTVKREIAHLNKAEISVQSGWRQTVLLFEWTAAGNDLRLSSNSWKVHPNTPTIWAENSYRATPLAPRYSSAWTVPKPTELYLHDKDIKEGKTKLHLAVETGNLNDVTLMLMSGANVNVCDTSGKTPLSTAIESGNLDVMKILVKHEVVLASIDQTYWDTIRYAVGQEEIIGEGW